MLRYALSPRWIPGHLLALGVLLVCLRLGLWQWEAGREPLEPGGPPRNSIQNLFYAAQWVFFGVVALWFWWRYLKDEKRADEEWDAEQAQQAEQAAASGGARPAGDPSGGDSGPG